jgi:hypothetical protein
MRLKSSFGALIVAIFIACAPAAPSANAASDDACKLLTPAQVGAAIGASVGAGKHTTPTYVKTCTWTTAQGANYQFVTLDLQESKGFERAKMMWSHAKGIVFKQVSGLGDDAFYMATGDNVGLNVKKGDVSFKVEVYAHVPVEKKEASEKPLAVEVVSKL